MKSLLTWNVMAISLKKLKPLFLETFIKYSFFKVIFCFKKCKVKGKKSTVRPL